MSAVRRVAELTEDYYMDFDAHILYHSGEAVAEVHGRALSVLEYFCSYPNSFKTIDDINEYLEQGTLSSSTVRGYVAELMNTHMIFEYVIKNRRGYGYKYLGNKIHTVGEVFSVPEQGSSEELHNFVSAADEFLRDFLKAILFCPCKWGSCSYDELPQNTNTCEGVLSILMSGQERSYAGLLEEKIRYLAEETGQTGLQSKSLKAETVVPTSMYLYICKMYNEGILMDKAEELAGRLWNARGNSGWGLYVKDMGQYANIGCTYWAVTALKGYNAVPEEEFQKYVRELFRYDNAYSYGPAIDSVNPRIPRLYATSMMYCIYQMLTVESRELIGKRYDPLKAIDHIVSHFDNPYFITEQEAIDGVETEEKVTVHTVSWNHMTMHYSMYAIALAIENGDIEEERISDILARAEKMIQDNSERSDGRLYGSGPDLTLERGRRGKMIFPTMHFVMGLSHLRCAVSKVAERKKAKEEEGK